MMTTGSDEGDARLSEFAPAPMGSSFEGNAGLIAHAAPSSAVKAPTFQARPLVIFLQLTSEQAVRRRGRRVTRRVRWPLCRRAPGPCRRAFRKAHPTAQQARVPTLTPASYVPQIRRGVPRPACGERAARHLRNPNLGPVRGRFHKLRLAETPPCMLISPTHLVGHLATHCKVIGRRGPRPRSPARADGTVCPLGKEPRR
jgi:hypothetical protein